MPGFLSDSNKADIRTAIKGLTDTFMTTPITYLHKIDSVDINNEDRKDQHQIVYEFLGLVEYENSEGSKISEGNEGSKDYDEVMITVNLEDLEALGLLNSSNRIMFSAERDYFRIRNQSYRVTDISYDGPLDEKDVLILIKGKKTHENLNYHTNAPPSNMDCPPVSATYNPTPDSGTTGEEFSPGAEIAPVSIIVEVTDESTPPNQVAGESVRRYGLGEADTIVVAAPPGELNFEEIDNGDSQIILQSREVRIGNPVTVTQRTFTGTEPTDFTDDVTKHGPGGSRLIEIPYVETPPEPSGIQYRDIPRSTPASVVDHDDGWLFDNGYYTHPILPNPVNHAMPSKNPGENPFTTLQHDNMFGNRSRFTAGNGAEGNLSASYGSIWIDHLYGVKLVMLSGSTSNWATQVIDPATRTVLGETGWFIFPFGYSLVARYQQAGRPFEYVSRIPFFASIGTTSLSPDRTTHSMVVHNHLDNFSGCFAENGITGPIRVVYVKRLTA